jgi:hypothetical protein
MLRRMRGFSADTLKQEEAAPVNLEVQPYEEVERLRSTDDTDRGRQQVRRGAQGRSECGWWSVQ